MLVLNGCSFFWTSRSRIHQLCQNYKEEKLSMACTSLYIYFHHSVLIWVRHYYPWHELLINFIVCVFNKTIWLSGLPLLEFLFNKYRHDHFLNTFLLLFFYFFFKLCIKDRNLVWIGVYTLDHVELNISSGSKMKRPFRKEQKVIIVKIRWRLLWILMLFFPL